MRGAIHVIHENDEWLKPLSEALSAAGLPHESWNLGRGFLDLGRTPPEGIFFSRMSASAHSRGHERSPELAGAVLAWLEAHGRRVVNGTGALRLELSKVAQLLALASFGFKVPRTVAAYGPESLIEAAASVPPPLILKPNRGGKGLGVRSFADLGALAAHLRDPGFEPSVDGLSLVQHQVASSDPFITRMEFIGGKFFYAVRVDASDGFELCPADDCPVGGRCAFDSGLKFEVADDPPPDTARHEAFLEAHGVEVCGIEFIVDRAGIPHVYDVNINTNYNRAAEAAKGVSAMAALASFLGRELALSERREGR
jgi:hypothetical protein